MSKKYLLFWLTLFVLNIVAIFVIVKFGIQKDVPPAIDNTPKQKLVIAKKILNVAANKKISNDDVKSIAENILAVSNPIISVVPKTNFNNKAKPNRIVFVGVSKTIPKGSWTSEVSIKTRLVNDFYFAIGVEIPIRRDSILQNAKIKLGIAWIK